MHRAKPPALSHFYDAVRLVPGLECILAARRYNLRADRISADLSGHFDRPQLRPGGGPEAAVFGHAADQSRRETRNIGEANLPSGYAQRVERSPWRLGAVALEQRRQRQFSDVFAVEPGRALRGRALRERAAAERRGEQETRSQPSRHSAIPVRSRCATRAMVDLSAIGPTCN